MCKSALLLDTFAPFAKRFTTVNTSERGLVSKRASYPCSRPSFFGGFVSTRKESALATWKPTLPSQLQSGQSNKVKASSASRGKPSNQVKAAPAPPSDPALLRKQQLKTNRNFDSDSDTEGDRPKPRAYNQQLAQLDQHLNAAEKAAAAKLPGLKPQHASQHLQQQQQNVYKSPYANVTSKAASAVRTVAPKGKAGAGSRNMALAPQVNSYAAGCLT